MLSLRVKPVVVLRINDLNHSALVQLVGEMVGLYLYISTMIMTLYTVHLSTCVFLAFLVLIDGHGIMLCASTTS
jgi:hypothetical protein